MTLAASQPTNHLDSADLRFNFKSAELTSHLRQATKRALTGYWTIHFEAADDREAAQWVLCLLNGQLVFSGAEVPTCQHFIEVMLRFSGLRKGKLGPHLKALKSAGLLPQDLQLKQTLRQLVVAGVVTLAEIEQAFHTYFLNVLDQYLLDSTDGSAFFTPYPQFEDYIPFDGFEVNSMLLESIRRRVEWATHRQYIPTLSTTLTLADREGPGKKLQENQWQTLKNLIQDGNNIVEIAQSMGKDSLMVAKSFSALIQQDIIQVQGCKSDRPSGIVQGSSEIPEIYIVDDSPVLVRQFRTLLEHWGYIVHASHESVNAVSQLAQVVPRVIFLDINMPEVSGFDLIKKIRREPDLAQIPLVMLTAEKSVSNQWRAQWASCKFLAKPRSAEDVPEFRQELRDILRELAPLSSDLLV
ncbi:response regulator [Lyngbya confervoides]|uniref:Response regulator n=1 Tax=Lyngbya confervoides BDU141951 TaxID=1574623 RepID=A0ABD4T9I8_9CYAN|nr:response regulator [Lyngbya confervoides]MCM1984925.1 response regulator [Lyngbya confervoides BDU141951]